MNQTLKFAILISLITGYGCDLFNTDSNVIIGEHFNPSKTLKVVVLEKLGNATVNNSTHVSVVPADYNSNRIKAGNIFVAEIIEHIYDSRDSLVLVSWTSDDSLGINYPSLSDIYKIEERVEINLKPITVIHNSRK